MTDRVDVACGEHHPLTVDEAAVCLGVTPRVLYGLLDVGVLEARRSGRRLLVEAHEIKRYLRRFRREGMGP